MNEAKPRRATNVTLSTAHVEEAKSLGIPLSRACEAGLVAAIRTERERRWRAENAEAITAWNAWTDRHGLPLGRFRQF